MPITINDLRDCYFSVTKTNGLKTLLENLRGNQRIKHQELSTLFSSLPDWNKTPGSSGHLSYKNKVTGITVTFQGHSGGRGDPTVKKVIVDQITTQLQLHLNILGNIVFQYTANNWKNEPMLYQQCLARYQAWVMDGKPLEEANGEVASSSPGPSM